MDEVGQKNFKGELRERQGGIVMLIDHDHDLYPSLSHTK
jgi:hypothetical protein